MRNIHTSDIQFNFICTNLATNTTFASCVVTVRGEGFSDDDAIKMPFLNCLPKTNV